ncbi:unnamed protein product [Mytilus coruscus]|uniref:DDE Tnp4 domain-containing protein n=1 Tax=Mytilus coruscus TaxID=42192 RepID=A0A6J8CZW7_MYTCO|nr:unnamed protein product [Mytilus coruscus]
MHSRCIKNGRESSTPRSSKYSRRDDVDSSVVNNVQLEVEVGNEAEVKQECDDLGGIEPMHQEMGVQCTILEINIWPSRDIVTDYMPDDFKYKFATTRVILDATETPIQKPSHVDAQSVTWSSYKHKNTIKTMIGCTPRGTVSYKDSIMADRGIMVQDLFAAQDVKNTPLCLKVKSVGTRGSCKGQESSIQKDSHRASYWISQNI